MQPGWILFLKKEKKRKKRKKHLCFLKIEGDFWSQGRLHVKVTLIHYVVSLPFFSCCSVSRVHVHSKVFFKYIACSLCDNSFTEFPKKGNE